jgi:hypothetical protein
MLSVPENVRQIIREDDVAWQAFQAGYLNLRAYAEQIQPLVEERCWKSVQVGTIVVALSRFRETALQEPALKPQLVMSSMSVRNNISVISYDRTQLPTIAPHLPASENNDTFHAVTVGDHEVTYILPTLEADELRGSIGVDPKSHIDHAVAVTMRLPQSMLREPNVIFALLARVAVLQVDVLEIISTHSELTVVGHEEQLDELLRGLRPLLH